MGGAVSRQAGVSGGLPPREQASPYRRRKNDAVPVHCYSKTYTSTHFDGDTSTILMASTNNDNGAGTCQW
jgi:hypothetical protein